MIAIIFNSMLFDDCRDTAQLERARQDVAAGLDPVHVCHRRDAGDAGGQLMDVLD